MPEKPRQIPQKSTARKPDPQQATLEHEQMLFDAGYHLIAGIDEVGRGALAGPVSVGIAVIDRQTQLEITGLTDSKALTAKRREAMVPKIRQWCTCAVGHASPAEIDELGITYALRLAAQRALTEIIHQGLSPQAVLLDGKHDWLSPAPTDLLGTLEPAAARYKELAQNVWSGPVTMVIKGDYQCASIAAASIVAKVERDALMSELAQNNPQYAWHQNKGYGSAAHRKAVRENGPSIYHRLSWSLPATDRQVRQAYRERAES